MNLQQASSATARSSHATDTHLHGRWLMIARTGWFVLVVLALVLFVASFPVYITQLQSVCNGSACATGQLTPHIVEKLSSLGFSISDYVADSIALTLVQALVWFTVAGVLVWRKSNDWMVLLVALMMVLKGISSTMNTVAGSHSAWQFPAELLDYLAYGLLILVILLFPNGRFVPRWTWLLMIVYIVEEGLYYFFPNSPLYSDPWFVLLDYLLWIGLVISIMATQLYRYIYVSHPVQRQQTKWVVFAITIGLLVEAGFSIPFLFSSSLYQPDSLYLLIYNTVSPFSLILIPLSFGIAILHYRLWDIDIIINRTLVYGTLTVLLALIYFGLIFVLQYLLRSFINQPNDVDIVVSTLAIAALFQPLRKRVQDFIDRRFYRRKYDAARTLAAFSTTLRSEVDLNQLSEQLVAVVQETMQPAHVSLWLSRADQDAKRRVSNQADSTIASFHGNDIKFG